MGTVDTKELEALARKWERLIADCGRQEYERERALELCVDELRALLAEPSVELVWMEVQPPEGASWWRVITGPANWAWLDQSGHLPDSDTAAAPSPAHAPWYGEHAGRTGWWWRKTATAPDAGRKEG